MSRISRGPLVRTFLRSFAIQGSWNYHTMMGTGFGFALLPVLRFLHRGDALEDAVARHSEHFNAHPYLATLALGAVARMEADGDPAEDIRRFKNAVRGPLGGLGDTLVWAAWLPTCLLAALVLAWAGVAPWFCVGAFLVIYNVGHLGLRLWGFRMGLRDGREVATTLRRASLGRWTEQVLRVAALLAGALLGLVLTGDPGIRGAPLVWVPLAVAAFVLGALVGQKAWRPAALAVVGGVGFILLIQMAS